MYGFWAETPPESSRANAKSLNFMVRKFYCGFTNVAYFRVPSKFQVKITGQGAVFGRVAFVLSRADDQFRDLGHGGGTIGRTIGGAVGGTTGGRVGGAVGGRSGADELHQRPFGRAAGRGAHVGAAHEGQSSGTDREETLRFGRGKDDGKPASGSQQAEDGVAQVA